MILPKSGIPAYPRERSNSRWRVVSLAHHDNHFYASLTALAGVLDGGEPVTLLPSS
jgi:hypothetical protein